MYAIGDELQDSAARNAPSTWWLCGLTMYRQGYFGALICYSYHEPGAQFTPAVEPATPLV